jgi:hypothetical protein
MIQFITIWHEKKIRRDYRLAPIQNRNATPAHQRRCAPTCKPANPLASVSFSARRRGATADFLEQDQAAADAQGYCFGAARRAEFAHDRTDMEFRGVLGNAEAVRDFLVAQAGGEHLEDFPFAPG